MASWVQTAFADHLDWARCTALIAEEDLSARVVALGGSLALLRLDLMQLVWEEEMARDEAAAL